MIEKPKSTQWEKWCLMDWGRQNLQYTYRKSFELPVKLEVPNCVPPSVVADHYRSILKSAGVKQRIRKNPIKEKNVRACVFVASKNDGRSFSEVMDEFHACHPDWCRFRDVHEFAAAARSAHLKLIGKRLRWKRKRGQRHR